MFLFNPMFCEVIATIIINKVATNEKCEENNNQFYMFFINKTD